MTLMVPSYLIWNMYLMVPNMYNLMVPPTCVIWFFQDSFKCNCQIWSPLPYMEQVLYGPPTCMYGPPIYGVVSYSPPHVHIIPLYLIWNRYHMVLLTCTYGPPHVKCLHILYYSYGPLEYDSYGPHTSYGIGI